MENILSIDVEGSIEGKIALFKHNFKYVRTKKCAYELENNINIILDLYSEYNIKADGTVKRVLS